MEYFGISNVDSLNVPFIIDKNLFPYIDKNELLDSVNTQKLYDITFKEEIVTDNNTNINSFNNTPILYEHRENPMLKEIWNNIKDGDIITNRAAKRSLSTEQRNEKIEKRIVEINGVEKEIFLIWREAKRNTSKFQRQIGHQAEDAVFKYPLGHQYTVYQYMKSYNEELQCTEHYTCEIDGFIKSQVDDEIKYEPTEFKSFTPTSKFQLTNIIKTDICIQCHLSGIEKVIFGLKSSDSKTMKLKLSKISDLKNKKELNFRLFSMKKNLQQLVQNYT